MPILTPEVREKEVTISTKIPESLKDEIERYLSFAKLNSISEFIMKASEYVLAKDRDWRKHKQTQTTLNATEH